MAVESRQPAQSSGPVPIRSDEDVHVAISDGSVDRPAAGFGSIVHVHKAFDGMFHVARAAARKISPHVRRAQATARQAASDAPSEDPASPVLKEASRTASATGRTIRRAPGRAEALYERVRAVDFQAQRRRFRQLGLTPPDRPDLPATPRQRRAARRMRRRVARSDRRRARLRRLTAPVRRRLSSATAPIRGSWAGKTARSAARAVARLNSRVRMAIWKVAAAPMLGLLIVVIIAALAMASSASQASSDCSGVSGTSGAMGDDYYYGPHGAHPMAYNSGASPMGYYYGNCTDFVAWRINRDRGSTRPPFKYRHDLTPLGGNGGQWGDPGNLPGWKAVGQASLISVGDVVSFKPGVDGSDPSAGHVAIVGAVSAGSVTTENYGRGKYFTQTLTDSRLQQWMGAGQVVVKHDPTFHGSQASTSSAAGCDVSGDANAGPASQDVADVKKYALQYEGGDQGRFAAVDHIFTHESGWRWNAYNSSGTCGGGNHAYGIPQSCPGSKMSSEGSDWKTNGKTQVRWGIKYMRSRYGGELQAWQYWQVHSAY